MSATFPVALGGLGGQRAQSSLSIGVVADPKSGNEVAQPRPSLRSELSKQCKFEMSARGHDRMRRHRAISRVETERIGLELPMIASERRSVDDDHADFSSSGVARSASRSSKMLSISSSISDQGTFAIDGRISAARAHRRPACVAYTRHGETSPSRRSSSSASRRITALGPSLRRFARSRGSSPRSSLLRMVIAIAQATSLPI